MLGLVLATAIVAWREKSTRAKAVKALAPQPIDMDADDAGMHDGFGDADPVDNFGTDQEELGEFASLDDESLK